MDVIVLNGGSSAGKSSIARSLQSLLEPVWLTFGVDDLIRALPGGNLPPGQQRTIELAADGTIEVSPEYRRLETAWYAGLAEMARAGVHVILDEVFLGSGEAQRRLADAFPGAALVWVGVRCTPAVAAARERERPDRVVGMARTQADRVHVGVRYDVEVDTTTMSPQECAAAIVSHLGAVRHDPVSGP